MKWVNSVRKMKSVPLWVTALSTSVLIGCSSGSDDPLDPPLEPPYDEVPANINGAAVKGPIVNGVVTVYELDPASDDLKGAVVASGTTNQSAAISNVVISDAFIRDTDIFSKTAYLIEVVGGEVFNSGSAPILNEQRVLIDGLEVVAETPVYATPLTTLALELARLQFDFNALEESDQANPDDSFLEAYASAEENVRVAFGFGLLSGDLTLRTQAPILATQSALNYRTAIEAFAAIVDSIRLALASGVDNDTLLRRIADDLTDGLVDGSGQQGAIEGLSVLQASNDLRVLITQDPSSLTIPGTAGLPLSDLDDIILAELASVAPGSTPATLVDPQPNPAAGGISDTDRDSFLDSEDLFPNNPREWLDSDGDCITAYSFTADDFLGSTAGSDSGKTCGDNSDYLPNDASVQTACDSGSGLTLDEQDALGCFADDDGDLVTNPFDAFPNNPLEAFDSDGDCATLLGYDDSQYLSPTGGNDCGDNFDRNICYADVTLRTPLTGTNPSVPIAGNVDGKQTITATMDKVERIIRLGDGVLPVKPEEIMLSNLFADAGGLLIGGDESQVDINIVVDVDNLEQVYDPGTLSGSGVTYSDCLIPTETPENAATYCGLLVGVEGVINPLPLSANVGGYVTSDPDILDVNGDGTHYILTYEEVKFNLALLSTTWEFKGATVIPSDQSCP